MPHKIRVIGISAFVGFLTAFPIVAAAGFIYLRYGHPPVATADRPFPDEAKIVHIALDARIDRQLTSPPFSATPGNLIAGAHVYVAHCAVCHGTPGQNSSFGKWEYPTAPQLWTKHRNGVVGVSDDPASVSYWKVDNGIRLTGMPSFQHILTDAEMWQVSLLVKNADQPLSPSIREIFDRATLSRAQATSCEKAVIAGLESDPK